jgi:hypothetical protein
MRNKPVKDMCSVIDATGVGSTTTTTTTTTYEDKAFRVEKGWYKKHDIF